MSNFSEQIELIKQANNELERPAGSYFAICTIIDAWAHVGAYIVKLPAGPPMQAVDLSQGSAAPIGARSIGGYPCGSRVLCCFDQTIGHAVIIGSVPKALADSRLILPESLVLRSRAGMFEDPMQYSEFNDEKSDMGNFSSGRPVDAIPGDWGYINELGVAVYIGKLMAALKSSDGAKVETFFGDDLLRLTGYNFELATAGLRDFKINDEGEYNEVIRRTMYPWEGLGSRTRGQDPTQAQDGKLQPGQEDSPYEPKNKDQLIVPRQTILRGYLGDGEREWTSAPPDSGFETYASQELHRGLAELNKHSDGTLSFRSAKAIIIEKYALLPVPKELIAPEDPLGDSAAQGYQPAGATANIPDYEWSDDQDPTSRAVEMYDYLAWFHNWYTTDGLRTHKKDWKLPDESEIQKPVAETCYSKSLSKLTNSFIADLPEFKTLKLDHRGGRSSVRYYISRSAINQLDDGSVVIEDGYGSQIVMSGGNITMNAPGDIWRRAGRSNVDWAGYDAIMRAGHSADISAAKHDVRIKAEHNLHCLAGNSRDHGALLLESRSVGVNSAADWEQTGERAQTHGVVVLCPKSSFHAMAGDVYVGCDPSSDRKIICIDGTHDGKVFIHGQQVVNDVKDLWAVISETGNKLLAVSQSALVASTPVNLFGGTIIASPYEGSTGDIVCCGDLVVHQTSLLNGGVLTNAGYAARQGAPFVGKMPARVDPGQSTYAGDVQSSIDQVQEIADQLHEIEIDDELTAPGSSSFRKKNGFSFRDSKKDLDLDESTFVLHEARWQMLMRLGKAGTNKPWNEPVVEAPNGEQTRPHPGNDAWTSWQAFGQGGAPANFDYSNGRAKARDGLTESGPSENKQTLEGGYKIMKQENS